MYPQSNYSTIELPQRWRSGFKRSPRKRKIGCSNPSCFRPRSWKQLVTGPLPNVRQWVWVSRVLGNDHYKRMPHAAVGVAPYRTITVQYKAKVKSSPSPVMVTSPYEWNILEWDDIPQTNKQKQLTFELDLPSIKIGCLYRVDRRLSYFLKKTSLLPARGCSSII